MLKKAVDWVFALPPDVVQEEEVALVGLLAATMNMPLSAGAKEQAVYVLGLGYLAAKAWVKGKAAAK